MSIENNNYMAKVAMNKSVLKEFHSGSDNRVVYLNDGDEFQICLFNPETFAVGAKISINGEAESGRIIIRPGERIWIERPLGKQKKYKFETYEVEDSEATEKATKRNGEIRVDFYKENRNNRTIVIKDPWTITATCTSDYYDKTDTTSLYCSTDNSLSTCDSFSVNSITTNSTSAVARNLTPISANVATCSATYVSAPETATIETGRIAMGSKSDQKFEDVDIDLDYFSYRSEIIKLLPMSRKSYTSSDLQKVYCTECGRKLNPKFKYCPYCGTKCLFEE